MNKVFCVGGPLNGQYRDRKDFFFGRFMYIERVKEVLTPPTPEPPDYENLINAYTKHKSWAYTLRQFEADKTSFWFACPEEWSSAKMLQELINGYNTPKA